MVRPCSLASLRLAGPTIRWHTDKLTAGATTTIMMQNNSLNTCIDTASSNWGTVIGTNPCQQGKAQQQFNILAGSSSGGGSSGGGPTVRFQSVSDTSVCLQVTNHSYLVPPVVEVKPCSAAEPFQQFAATADGTLRSPAAAASSPLPGVVDDSCIAAAGFFDCFAQNAAVAEHGPLGAAWLRLWCDPSAAGEDRARALVDSLTLIEKVDNLGTGGSMSTPAGSGPTWNEGLHGLEWGCGEQWHWDEFGGNNSGCPTSFPHGTALGSTFNRTLWGRVGTTISEEARGFHNIGNYPNPGGDSLFFFSPSDINLARDPRWGRAQEVASEDPFMNGEFGIAVQTNFETMGGRYKSATPRP